MMLDQQNTLSENQAVTSAAVNSTNTIDLGANGTGINGYAPNADTGKAFHGRMLVQVTENFAGGTSLQAQLITSDSANLGTPTVIQETAAIPLATLKKGYQFALDAPPPGITQRYLGVRYVPVGTFTAGKVTAAIVWDKQTN